MASDSLVSRVELEVGVVAGELVQGRLEQREHVTVLEFAPSNKREKFCKRNSLKFDIT